MSACESDIQDQVVWLNDQMQALYSSHTVDRVMTERGALNARGRYLANLVADIGMDRIQLGLARLATSGREFPPSIPAFRQMCLPSLEDLGIPDAEVAYEQACHGRFPHPLARYATIACGGTRELARLDRREAIPIFRSRYQALCKRVMAGETLEEPNEAAPQLPANTDPDPEAGRWREHRKRLLKHVGLERRAADGGRNA